MAEYPIGDISQFSSVAQRILICDGSAECSHATGTQIFDPKCQMCIIHVVYVLAVSISHFEYHPTETDKR